jgi:hypothetical protein
MLISLDSNKHHEIIDTSIYEVNPKYFKKRIVKMN